MAGLRGATGALHITRALCAGVAPSATNSRPRGLLRARGAAARASTARHVPCSSSARGICGARLLRVLDPARGHAPRRAGDHREGHRRGAQRRAHDKDGIDDEPLRKEKPTHVEVDVVSAEIFDAVRLGRPIVDHQESTIGDRKVCSTSPCPFLVIAALSVPVPFSRNRNTAQSAQRKIGWTASFASLPRRARSSS